MGSVIGMVRVVMPSVRSLRCEGRLVAFRFVVCRNHGHVKASRASVFSLSEANGVARRSKHGALEDASSSRTQSFGVRAARRTKMGESAVSMVMRARGYRSR